MIELRVGKWTVSYDPPPIPMRELDYVGVHADYDGAPDANDHRCLRGPSVDDVLTQIYEYEVDVAAEVHEGPPVRCHRCRDMIAQGDLVYDGLCVCCGEPDPVVHSQRPVAEAVEGRLMALLTPTTT